MPAVTDLEANNSEIIEDIIGHLDTIDFASFRALVLVQEPTDSDEHDVLVWAKYRPTDTEWQEIYGTIGCGVAMLKGIEQEERAARETRVYDAAKALINEAMRRHPGEEFKCPFMQELTLAVGDRP